MGIVDRVVISVKGSPRTAQFLGQPSGASFRVHWACNGRLGEGLDRFDVAGFERRYGRLPAPGEIGCAISHLDVLTDFGEGRGGPDDVLLVAEDDAVLAEDFEEVLRRVAATSGWDWVLLANPFEPCGLSYFDSRIRHAAVLAATARPVGSWHRPFKYRLGRFRGWLYGAGLYLVTRRSARLLVDLYRSETAVSWVADDYRDWHVRAGLTDIRLLRPNLAGWLGGSEIAEVRPHFDQPPSGADHSQSLSLRLRWLRRRLPEAMHRCKRAVLASFPCFAQGQG